MHQIQYEISTGLKKIFLIQEDENKIFQIIQKRNKWLRHGKAAVLMIKSK